MPVCWRGLRDWDIQTIDVSMERQSDCFDLAHGSITLLTFCRGLHPGGWRLGQQLQQYFGGGEGGGGGSLP